MSHDTSPRTRRRIRNIIIRLSVSVLLIVSVLLALNSMGFFNRSVSYSPVSDNFYHSAVSPSGQASYGGSCNFEISSEGSADNNSATFNDGVKGPRTRRTSIIGNGEDIFTVMIYMCGSDMESTFGLGSADIEEMKAATKSKKLNIIIQTGGAYSWKDNSIKSTECQRFKISDGKLTRLSSESNLTMSNYASLTSFLEFCKEKYTANRYALIFWGHGGGSLGGYGHDEINSPMSVTINEINQSLYSSGMTFDFIGFDASFMATYDTAYVMNFYSDYLIASQETVPACGWNYTNWLSAIAENPSIETTDIAKIIIDDYINDCHNESAYTSMTLIDLTDFNNLVVPSMVSFSDSVNEMMSEGEYSHIAKARAASREFITDNIDLMEFSERVGGDNGRKLVEALMASVRYNRTSTKLINTNGLSLYFPFDDLDNFNQVINAFYKININSEYFNAIRKFANISIGGRLYLDDTKSDYYDNGISSDVSEHFSNLSQSDAVNNKYNWVDSEFVSECYNYYRSHSLNAEKLKAISQDSVNGETFSVFNFSENDRELIADIKVEAYIYSDSDDSYIFIGSDSPVLEYLNKDRLHLIADCSSSWLSVAGADVCAELVDADGCDSDRRLVYRIPVLLSHSDAPSENGNTADEYEISEFKAYLYVTLDNYSSGFSSEYRISHAEIFYEYPVTPVHSKSLSLNEGDIITPLRKYVDRGFSQVELAVSDSDSFEYTDDIIINTKDYSSSDGFRTFFVFTDIYGNTYRAPVNTVQAAVTE